MDLRAARVADKPRGERPVRVRAERAGQDGGRGAGTLYCIILYCIVLYCTVLYYTVVQVCDTRIPGKRWEALGHGPQRFPTAYNTEELPGEEWQDDVHKFTDPSIQYAA